MIFSLFILIQFCLNNIASSFDAEQIHLSFTGNENSMSLDFVSSSSTASVEYLKVNELQNYMVSSPQSEYFDHIGYLYNCEMTSLEPGYRYKYRIGYQNDWTEWIEFLAGSPKRYPSKRIGEIFEENLSEKSEDSIMAVYADFGLNNDVSMKRLITEDKLQRYDHMALVGDISYNLFDDNSQNGNKFMNLVSNFAKHKPFMVGPGNHEHSDNFTEYVKRFQGIANGAGQNSGSKTNFYYSYNVGLVHYIMVNTEVWAYPSQTASSPYPFTPEEQLEWLEQDLIKANQNREKVPWIVMMGHKGWYMNEWGDLRIKGEISTNFTQFDYLGCKYGVDLYLTGHVHLYQRFLPVRGPKHVRFMAPPSDVDYECTDSSEGSHVYNNPKYMPTIVVASPGNQEISPRIFCTGLDVLNKLFWEESQVLCTTAYGFGHLQAVNETHLYWEFVLSGKSSNINDTREEPSDLTSIYPDGWTKRIEDAIDGTEQLQKHFHSARRMRLSPGFEPKIHFLEDDQSNMKTGSQEGRLVKDYLWIKQEKHGLRDYCEL